MIELNVLKDLVPKTQKAMITEELVDTLNEWDKDPLLVDSFRENLLGYIGVLKDGRFKIEDYMNAVRFVSYKLLKSSNIDAYVKVFPERYNRLLAQGLTRDQISAYSTAYNKNKLVNAIMEQTLIPSHIYNAPLHQEALNEAARIMLNSRSDMARVQAINTILAHTKAPEVQKIELDVGVKQMDSIDDLRKATEALAIAQAQSIEAGVAVKKIAESTIIDANIEED